MFDVLLSTKLFLPPARPDWVPRPRLLERLDGPGPSRLVLISAPAGYGKTTLATAWLHRLRERGAARVCWLTLDPDDSDPRRFFRYLAAAVEPLPGVQGALPQLLQSDQTAPARTLMQAFVHDVTPVDGAFLLVLDDYHALDAPAVEEALAMLLEWMPPQMTLVLTSRSDPGFPLARLRARGRLLELRADDLRFTRDEAAHFLRQSMGLQLQPGQIAALEQRTEGWIAGLQMAAHSMQARDAAQVDRFVQSFAGSHRFILDYLLEEALEQQPAGVRSFLLATAFLERLSGPLCNAVTGGNDGQALLEQLERKNLFVVPLDDARGWYRYHHLFADVLQAHAQAQDPHQEMVRQRRAAAWFADHGAPGDAIRHALAGRDFAHAASLLEQIRPTVDGSYAVDRWLAWARVLPEETVRARPVLCAGFGWALLEQGELAAGAARLDEAQRWLDAPDRPDAMVVVDDAEWQSLPASLDGARAYHALALGDVSAALDHAGRAVDFFADEDEHRWRQVGLSLLGVAAWMTGDLAASTRAFADLTRSARRAGKLVDAISTAYVLAEMQLTLGELNQAEAGLVQMLEHASDHSDPPPLGAGDLHRVLAHLAWERGQEDTAQEHLATAIRLGRDAALTNWAHRLRLTQARIKISMRDWQGALALLDEAEALFVENPLPAVQPVPALRAQIWIGQGALEKAAAWADEEGLSPDHGAGFLREFELLTLARLLIARGQAGDAAALTQARHLLARLLEDAAAGGRTGTVLAGRIAQALAHAAADDLPAALAPLADALALAEPQGYQRLFVDEGAPMVELLQAAVKAGLCVPYATRLLAALGADAGSAAPEVPPPQPLPEPLSARELEVLALVAAGYKNKEIAGELVISLNTVLYHTKNIYGKLGVNKRALAIAKARELGLIA